MICTFMGLKNNYMNNNDENITLTPQEEAQIQEMLKALTNGDTVKIHKPANDIEINIIKK